MIESLDIQTLQKGYESNRLDPFEVLAAVLRRIEAYSDPAVWIDRFPKSLIDQQIAESIQRKRAGIAQPLFGIPFSIKDNIDFTGRPTTAACPAFSYVPQQSAAVVQRLCDAGAIAVGKTNLDQFATGLVGTRSPYGACRNTFNPQYISGGSSSGSAVSVAAGLVSFSLGTDTAGSGRVPAALNNIVGLKPTRGLLSTRGLVPACKSLDCISILSLSCDDARTVLQIVEGPDPIDPYSRSRSDLPPGKSIIPHRFTFGVPDAQNLQFFGNNSAKSAFLAAVERLKSIGGVAVETQYAPFANAAALLYSGPWVAERYLVAKHLLETQPDALLPVTRSIIAAGQSMNAAGAFKAFYALQELIQRAKTEWARIDLLLLPTVGTAYTIDQINADPVRLNSNLGYYTNFLNLMDLSAIAIPAGFQNDGVPFGVTLVAPAGSEDSLLNIGDALHRALDIGPSVSKHPLPPPAKLEAPMKIKLAVVGAHLSGMPLNHQLTERHATLVRAARTAPLYKLYALPGTTPPKPGLVRGREGHAIELEIWEMPPESFATFVAAIPSPLGIASIQLEDGQSVQGFLCESFAVENAQDISHFGGWRGYMKSR